MDMLHERFDAGLAEEFPAPDIRQGFASPRRAAPKAASAMFHAQAAVPDVAAEVGGMIVAAFAAIMLAFLLLFANGSLATMLLGIGIGITTIYIAVPAIFLRIESAHSDRISYAAFLEKGLQTWTGQLPARRRCPRC